MPVVANLINPTPFDVKINHEKGIYINVPADGETTLSMQQLDDYRPGKPGSEATKSILAFEGVFLQDTDLSYDFQALQALKGAVRERKDRIKQFTDRTKGSRVQGGAPIDDDSMEELIVTSGHGTMRSAIVKLEARIKILQGIVSADEAKGSVRQTLDPARTCFVINPPRQFPSKTALMMFLAEQSEEVQAKHEAFTNPTAPTVVTGTEALFAEGDE